MKSQSRNTNNDGETKKRTEGQVRDLRWYTNANPGPPARPPRPRRDEQGQRGTDPAPEMT